MLRVRAPLPDEITAVRPPDVLSREIARIGASAAELEAAEAFNATPQGFDARAYDALPPRTRRLVDLLAVARPAREEIRVDVAV